MAFMKVLAGDIPEGEWVFTGWGDLAVMSRGFGRGGSVDLNNQLSSVEQVTEESAKRLAASTAWAAVGGLTFGPLGVLGGWLLGGKKKTVCFAAVLKDDRRFLAECDHASWKKIVSASFRASKAD